MTPELVVRPYMNWGRWVADCPREPCSNAEHFGPDPNTKHVGGLTDVMFVCSNCRLQCAVEWPAEREAIDLVLGQRPVPSTRNWRPGERVADLVKENVLYDVVDVVRGE